MKRLALLLVSVAVLIGACGIEVGDVRAGPAPICDTTSRGMLVLMAQAVPSADLIPCVERLPGGWVIERAEIETGSAEVSIDGGSVGDLLIELEAGCEPSGTAIDNGGFEAAAYEATTEDEIVRFYVFAGGCVTVTAPNRFAVREMTSQISFLTRDGLSRTSGLEL